jgi:hypothetical protein
LGADAVWVFGAVVVAVDYVGAADTLAVPVVCGAVFELEFHVFDALVDDVLRKTFVRRTSADSTVCCGRRIPGDSDSRRSSEEEGQS